MNTGKSDAATHPEFHDRSPMSKSSSLNRSFPFAETRQRKLHVLAAIIGRSGVMLPGRAFLVPIASAPGVLIVFRIRSGKDICLGHQAMYLFTEKKMPLQSPQASIQEKNTALSSNLLSSSTRTMSLGFRYNAG